MSDQGTPAGWYDDKQHPGQLRYWDGTAWTEHYAPNPSATTTPAAIPKDGAPGKSRNTLIGCLAVLLIALAIGCGLTQCGGKSDSPSSSKPTSAAPSKVATSSATAKPPKPAAPKEPASEAAAGAKTLTAAEQDYLAKLMTINSTLTDAMSGLSALTTDETKVVLLLGGDQDTVIEAATYLAVMRKCEEDVDAITPPSRFVASHAAYAEAMDLYKASTDHFADGVDNHNPEEINKAASLMTQGAAKISEATTELQKAKP